MDSNPLVFDISSDEEPAAFEEPTGCDDDHDWLTGLLETVDKRSDGNDDEVVVVSEYNPPIRAKSKSMSSREDDDDCVILDGDPDKPIAVDDGGDGGDARDGDDLLVVGEKGQIACRDYPHSRHLCAKFPFISTSHETHCDLCHCYVCDSLAPCLHWDTGNLGIDHCHATDKQEMWKQLRESFRAGKNAPLPVPTLPCTTLPVAGNRPNPITPLDSIQSLPNSIPQTQASRPTTISASCSSSTMFTIPSIICQGRNRQLGSVGRARIGPRSISHPPLGVRNANRRRRTQTFGNLSGQFVCPDMIVKRCLYVSSNDLDCVPPSQHSATTAPLPNGNNCAGHQDLSSSVSVTRTVQSSCQPNTGCDTINTVPSQPSGDGQLPVSDDCHDLYPLGNQTRNAMDSVFSDFDFNFGENNWQTSVQNAQPNCRVFNDLPPTNQQFSAQCTGDGQVQYEDHGYGSSFFSQSVPVVSEGHLPIDMSAFSSDCPAVDADGVRSMRQCTCHATLTNLSCPSLLWPLQNLS